MKHGDDRRHRGRAQWRIVPGQVWAHPATIMLALALTPTMLLRPRGARLHRLLGRVRVVMMIATAAISDDMRLSGHGRFSIVTSCRSGC